jgi:SAM-dependent methyltransferase
LGITTQILTSMKPLGILMIEIKDFFISPSEKERLSVKANVDFQMFQGYMQFVQNHYPNKKPRILELGCGTYKQIPILFHSYGFPATGIDNFSHEVKPTKINIALQNYLKQKFYYSRLRKEANCPINSNADIRDADALSMPFSDREFDVVFSNAVFEHISNIPKATLELHRVMKKGGRARIGIHLFASISGSHNPNLWQNPVTELPVDLQPWYHLRDLPGHIPSDLNRFREHQYRECFNKHFKIENEIFPHYLEGEKFLTADLLRELSDYSKEELLRRWIVFELVKL